MIIWVIFSFIFLMTILYGEQNSPKKEKIYPFIFVCLVLFSGLRFDVGFDYPNYWNCMAPIEDPIFTALTDDYEYGSIYYQYGKNEIIPKFIYLLVEYARWRPLLFCLYSFFTYLFVFYTIKNYSLHPFVSLSFYIAFFYLSSLGVIRQALAVSIIFFSYKFVVKKQLIRFVILVIIASLIHKSAVVSIVIYPVYHYFHIWDIIFFLGIAFFLENRLLFIFDDLGYNSLLMEGRSFRGGSIVRFVFLILLFYFYFQNIKCPEEKKNENYRLLQVVSIGVILPFFGMGHLSTRLSEYFSIFTVLLISNCSITLWKNRHNIIPFFHIILFSYFILSIFWSSQNKSKSPFTPYRCVLMTNKEEFKEWIDYE